MTHTAELTDTERQIIEKMRDLLPLVAKWRRVAIEDPAEFDRRDKALDRIQHAAMELTHEITGTRV